MPVVGFQVRKYRNSFGEDTVVGISFQVSSAAAREFTCLRGYRPPFDGQATDADGGIKTLEAETWQDENSQGTISLKKILDSSDMHVIGLFGLDKQTAQDCRSALSSRQHVIDLGIRPQQDERFAALNDDNDDKRVLRRIAEVCGLKDFTDAAIETLRKMLEWSSPLVFIFDATELQTIDQRIRFCEAVVGFRQEFHFARGHDHRCVVLMRHRYYFDDRSGRVEAYLPQAAAWFRTETTLPNMPLGEQYLIRDRAQTEQRGGAHPAFFGFRPVERRWIHDRLNEGFKQPGGSLQFITGLAGTGKSTVLLRMADMPELNDRHTLICVCGFDRLRGETDIRAMLKQLCKRLLLGLGWDDRLSNAQDDAGPDRHADVEAWRTYVRLLLRAASDWVAGPASFYAPEPDNRHKVRRSHLNRIVIAIDALDEADAHSQEYTTNWLINQCIQNPRPGIHVICMARNDEPFHPREATFKLDELSATRLDLQEFVDINAPWLSDLQRRQVVNVGNGNFLVTALLLHHLHAHSPNDLNSVIQQVQIAAHGAGDIFAPIYELFWNRFAMGERNEDRKLAAEVIADLLCVAPAPVPPAMIHDVCGTHYHLDVWRVVQPVCNDMIADALLVADADGHYAPYHNTFSDYLQALRRHGVQAERYKQSRRHAAEWCHKRVQEWLGGNIPVERLHPADRYAARWIADHLSKAQMYMESYELLNNPEYIRRVWSMRPYDLREWWRLIRQEGYSPVEAYQHLLNAEPTPEMRDPTEAVAYLLLNLGYNDKAEYLFRRLMALENDTNLESQRRLAKYCNTLAAIVTRRSASNQNEADRNIQWQEVLELRKKAEGISKKIGDCRQLAAAVAGQVEPLAMLGEPLETVLGQSERAEMIFMECGDDHGRAICLCRRARVIFQANSQEALEKADKLYELAEQLLRDPNAKAKCLEDRARVLSALGRREEADRLRRDAEKLWLHPQASV